MPVPASIKARVALLYLKGVDNKISNTQDLDKANALAWEALTHLRDRGFRIKIDTLSTTREYEITVFGGFNRGGKKIMTVTGYHLWSAVRSVLFHFLQ